MSNGIKFCLIDRGRGSESSNHGTSASSQSHWHIYGPIPHCSDCWARNCLDIWAQLWRAAGYRGNQACQSPGESEPYDRQKHCGVYLLFGLIFQVFMSNMWTIFYTYICDLNDWQLVLNVKVLPVPSVYLPQRSSSHLPLLTMKQTKRNIEASMLFGHMFC